MLLDGPTLGLQFSFPTVIHEEVCLPGSTDYMMSGSFNSAKLIAVKLSSGCSLSSVAFQQNLYLLPYCPFLCSHYILYIACVFTHFYCWAVLYSLLEIFIYFVYHPFSFIDFIHIFFQRYTPFNFIVSVFLCNKFFNIAKSINLFLW